MVFGLFVVATGGFDTNISIDMEFSRLEGFWLALALPAVLLVLGFITFPVSYFIFRALTKRKPKNEVTGS